MVLRKLTTIIDSTNKTCKPKTIHDPHAPKNRNSHAVAFIVQGAFQIPAAPRSAAHSPWYFLPNRHSLSKNHSRRRRSRLHRREGRARYDCEGVPRLIVVAGCVENER